MKKLDIVVCFMLCLGGLNWGLIGLFDFNLIEKFVGQNWLDRLLYFVIGVSGIFQLVCWKSMKKRKS